MCLRSQDIGCKADKLKKDAPSGDGDVIVGFSDAGRRTFDASGSMRIVPPARTGTVPGTHGRFVKCKISLGDGAGGGINFSKRKSRSAFAFRCSKGTIAIGAHFHPQTSQQGSK